MVNKIQIMGIVNLTPDSFFAESRVGDDALARIEKLFAEGADVIDLGACSTRPGAPRPGLEEEWRRLSPVLQALKGKGYRLSIDTYRAKIVRRAFDIVGPFIVNDVSGAEEKEMLPTVASLDLPYVATHCRKPERPVVEDVKLFFEDFEKRALEAGVQEWILDPGFGFGKDIEENFSLLEGLRSLDCFGREILVGVSRKRMIYQTLGITPEEAMPGTQVLQFAALERGTSWLRVHDVAEAVRTARLYSTMYTSSPGAAK